MERLAVIFGIFNDGTLWDKHFGDSEKFVKYYIYPDREAAYDGETDNKTRDFDEEHNSAGKLSEVIKSLGNCDCVAAVAMSPNFKRMAAEKKIQPVVVKAENSDELLNLLKINFSRVEELAVKRANGIMEKEVPVITT